MLSGKSAICEKLEENINKINDEIKNCFCELSRSTMQETHYCYLI